jgi:hypothetical protein
MFFNKTFWTIISEKWVTETRISYSASSLVLNKAGC